MLESGRARHRSPRERPRLYGSGCFSRDGEALQSGCDWRRPHTIQSSTGRNEHCSGRIMPMECLQRSLSWVVENSLGRCF